MSTKILSPRHERAREYAAAGIKVFPCVAGAKHPACSNGYKDATTDLGQIDAWWSEADYNIGLCPEDAGWIVVDIDTKKVDGEANWRALPGEKPDTYTVRTPSGGLHFYYQGSGRSSASALAPGVDTRGIGGYVVVPPSVVDGQPYEALNDHDPVDAPQWVLTSLATRAERSEAIVKTLDEPGNVGRARTRIADWLRSRGPAVAGRGGNTTTYKLACQVQELGVSEQVCRNLLSELYNPKCEPPWSDTELADICAHAASYMQNAAGAHGAASAAETFKPETLARVLADRRPEKRSRFYFEDDDEQDASGEDVTWVFPELIPDRTLCLIVGPKGNFKSFVAHHLALSLAAGKPSMGFEPTKTATVFYGAHEGRGQIKRPRKRAWKLGHQIEGKLPIFVAPAPRLIVEGEVEEFKEQIRQRLVTPGIKHIGCIVLDTVAKCMTGMDENSAMDAGSFVAFCDDLIEEFECSVIGLHHTPKHGARVSRGSGALEAGAGTVIDVERTNQFVAIKVRHHKDAEERDEPWYAEGRQIGPALAFFPVTEDEHARATTAEDALDKRKVGAALKSLKAHGVDHGVTSVVLATELVPNDPNQSAEARLAEIERVGKELARRAKGKLEPYCTRAGRDLVWHLPERMGS